LLVIRRVLAGLTLLVVLGAGVAALRARGEASAASASVAASVPLGRQSDQQVAVAYLDPYIVLDVDVVTGRLVLSGWGLNFKGSGPIWSEHPALALETGVVGIEDPLARHRLFRYAGGIPGLAAAGSAPGGSAALPAPGALTVWGPPREVLRHGRLVALVFPDGRGVGVRVDGLGRLLLVRWMDAFGAPLVTRVAYSGELTSVTDPFGVTRVYEHVSPHRVFELVPASWRRGHGYRHWISPVLDGARETGWVQYRASPPRFGQLTGGLGRFAGPGFGGISFDSPANGGYVQVGMNSLRWARRVEDELRQRGLLDVSAILPTYDRVEELYQASDSLHGPLSGALADCHASWGDGVDAVVIDVSSTITPQEVARLDGALSHLNAWAIIERHGGSECASF
jgi:hypothetical protein